MFNHPSEPAPDSETALNSIHVAKWPFWIADGILLTFAIMLFVKADGQPSQAALLIAVLAVSMGAVAFLTPYLFELILRYRFLVDRWDDMSVTATLESRIKQLQGQVELLNKADKSIASEINSLSATIHGNNEVLAARVQDLEQQQVQSQAVQDLPSESPIAENEPQAVENNPQEEQNQPQAVENPAEPAVAAEDPVASPPPPAASKAERPRRGLLHRAMEQGNGSADTPAVKRIIGRTFSPRLVSSVDAAAKTEKLPGDPSDVEVSRENVATATPQTEQKNEVKAPATKEVEETSLFPEMSPTPRRAAKPKSNETVVLARVLIGIGNKPYIRGDLPGLNPDKGTAMDFREIGVWQWVSPEVVSPGKIRIFRNDQDPEQASFHDIAPGQCLEIQPKFPKSAEKF
jgi:hypothetical protein